jgi:hypothetical protein
LHGVYFYWKSERYVTVNGNAQVESNKALTNRITPHKFYAPEIRSLIFGAMQVNLYNLQSNVGASR